MTDFATKTCVCLTCSATHMCVLAAATGRPNPVVPIDALHPGVDLFYVCVCCVCACSLAEALAIGRSNLCNMSQCGCSPDLIHSAAHMFVLTAGRGRPNLILWCNFQTTFSAAGVCVLTAGRGRPNQALKCLFLQRTCVLSQQLLVGQTLVIVTLEAWVQPSFDSFCSKHVCSRSRTGPAKPTQK